jgi:hypothetical protein
MKEALQVFMQELNASELFDEVSKNDLDSVKNRRNLVCFGKSTGVTWEINCLYWHSAHRQQELHEGLNMELWKPADDG